MAIQDVFDDRKTKTGAAFVAASAHVNSVEPLGQTRNGLAWDFLTFILDCDEHLLVPGASDRSFRAAEANANPAPLTSVFDRVVNQVLEQLRQLIAIADDGYGFVR